MLNSSLILTEYFEKIYGSRKRKRNVYSINLPGANVLGILIEKTNLNINRLMLLYAYIFVYIIK